MKTVHETRSNFGPKPKLMKWDFTGLVRPVLTYGAMIWGHAANTVGNISKLRKLNRMALNTITSVRRSNPTRALEIIYDIMPLHLEIQKIGMASFVRLKQHITGQKHLYSSQMYKKLGHLNRWERLAKDTGVGSDNNDYTNVTYREKLYHVNTDSFNGGSKHLQSSQINIYTDGSRLEDKCGTGYVIYKKRKEIFRKSSRLPDTSTVFQAEVNGILLASKFLLNEVTTIKPKYIKIFSDSQVALLALNQSEVSSKLVLETKETLNLLAQRTRRITLVWIKVHVGHPGNEVADELAKKATKEDKIDNKINTPLAYIKDNPVSYTHLTLPTIYSV